LLAIAAAEVVVEVSSVWKRRGRIRRRNTVVLAR
jgi:hypothetical protein